MKDWEYERRQYSKNGTLLWKATDKTTPSGFLIKLRSRGIYRPEESRYKFQIVYRNLEDLHQKMKATRKAFRALGHAVAALEGSQVCSSLR